MSELEISLDCTFQLLNDILIIEVSTAPEWNYFMNIYIFHFLFFSFFVFNMLRIPYICSYDETSALNLDVDIIGI